MNIMNAIHAASAVHDVTTQLLREWPLPMPGLDGDKEERGHVLILGGSREMPGAVILAATAALRAGQAAGQRHRVLRGARGQRDAENRSSTIIAEQIKTRLAAYFISGG